jgi:hypothetical protein
MGMFSVTGMEDAMPEGLLVWLIGFDVGDTDEEVGCFEGRLVTGEDVGASESEGLLVGYDEGLRVGNGVGRSEGGAVVGLTVGLAVGGVGCRVGGLLGFSKGLLIYLISKERREITGKQAKCRSLG